MSLTYSFATHRDAAEIAALRTAGAEKLTHKFGIGPWSTQSTEKSVLLGMRRPQFERILLARKQGAIVAALNLQTKKPWAIDVAYFTPVPRALYLVGMSVHPDHQGTGAGRAILQEAENVARRWDEHTAGERAESGLKKKSPARELPVTAIRLDAWDAAAGAGPFYEKCGYRNRGHVIYKTNPLVYYERVW